MIKTSFVNIVRNVLCLYLRIDNKESRIYHDVLIKYSKMVINLPTKNFAKVNIKYRTII